MLNFSLTPNAKILSKDADSYPYMYRNYPFLRPWVDSLKQVNALKDTFIINPQGIQLHAFYITAPAPTSKTAVIVHGYTDNAIRMFMIGYLYNRDLGYPASRLATSGRERRTSHPNGMERQDRCFAMDEHCK